MAEGSGRSVLSGGERSALCGAGDQEPGLARYYARHSTFASTAAPRIRARYEATYGDDAERSVLDVCCGVGTLAEHFLSHGYTVTGIDLSEPMLALARQNLDGYLQAGQVRLIQADAASFSVDGRFGLATCTFDALNMLQSREDLSSCFACMRRALAPTGMFVFDLMTRNGFWLDYNYFGVRDTEDELYIFKSVYDGAEKATARLTGFIRDGDRWERFDEFRTPTLFPAPPSEQPCTKPDGPRCRSQAPTISTPRSPIPSSLTGCSSSPPAREPGARCPVPA
jgi:SAM-dependent methyltransferase